jgi:predicted ATPase
LTQEVAYNSLLIERRKQLHEGAGQALESIFSGQLDDHLGQLAHHYSHSDNVDKAIEYLGRAGQQKMQRSAHADAINDLTAAIDLTQRLSDGPERIQRELFLQLTLGQAFILLKAWAAQEVERAFTRARELCERLGDPPELFPVLLGIHAVHFVRAELGTAYELAERLLRRAQGAHDPALVLCAHNAVGMTSCHMGELLRAKEHFEIAISLYDRERHRSLAFQTGVDAGVGCLTYAAWILWHLGYPDQALKRGNEAFALAQELSHPHSLAFAGEYFAGLRQYRREAHSAQESAERVIALCAEQGFPSWLAVTTIMRGWAMAKQGRNEEGFAQIKEGLAAYRATGGQIGMPYHIGLLAEACMETGRIDEGLAASMEALVAADQHEEHLWDPEIHRLKGELLLKRDHSSAPEAQICFERAIEIAGNQSAKSLELRATMSLAQLLHKQGHRDEARTMLADIYNWFTEGFDTADLKDAKALLDELDK